MTDKTAQCQVCGETKPKNSMCGVGFGSGPNVTLSYTCTDCIKSHGADHMFAPVGEKIRDVLTGKENADVDLGELTSKPLACWCRRSDDMSSTTKCHGDVLVELWKSQQTD